MSGMTDTIWTTLLPFIASGLVLPTGCMDKKQRACHHVSFCVYGAHRRDLVASLEQDSNVLASGGSACSSVSSLPSHVLAAMQVPLQYIHGSVRITISHNNTPDEITNTLCPALVKLLEKRSLMPL